MSQMLIAIDYDDTYTRDPTLFAAFITMARGLGHHIVCITARGGPDLHDVIDPVREPPLPIGVEVHYSAGKPKREYARALNLHPHIWIDDTPESVGVAYMLNSGDDDD